MMRILGKGLMFIGVLSFFLGAGAMDSPSLFAPIVMILAGIGLIGVGNKIEKEFI